MLDFERHNQVLEASGPSEAKVSPIYIVGAGAGDASHLTLAAAEAISSADVIFVDDLVDASIQALIPEHVEIRKVGKRAGRLSATQDQIIAGLIASAQAGQRVVRLKGGDPLIFGRGGEEASAVRASGLDVVIVPGVTAALIAAASTGIPLTDRRYAQQVTFITGTDSGNDVPTLKGLAGLGRTLVIYMGSRQARRISEQLQADSVPLSFPAAIVHDAGRPSQNLIVTTVGQLAAAIARGDHSKPALIIVGEVVSLCPTSEAESYQEVHFAHG
jgi:uroporphyrin-III C-methyltransferase